MDKVTLKKEILKCIEEEMSRLEQTFKGRLQGGIEEASEHNDDQASYDEGGFWDVQVEENSEKLSIFQSQLESALTILNKMKQTPIKEHSKVALGSVVTTNNGVFFISFAFQPIKFNGHTYTPIAQTAPIYEALGGCQKGDSFDFNGKKFEILDVF